MATETLPYTRLPMRSIASGAPAVQVFVAPGQADSGLLRSFGEEWRKFGGMDESDLRIAGGELFDLWPINTQNEALRMIDVGCGNGRWTRYLADRVAHVDALDPSEAVLHAAERHADLQQVRWSMARAEDLPFPDNSYQRALCIGVLHHLKDPGRALDELRRVLVPGGVLYFYLYYAMEQRGLLFRSLFRLSDALRRLVHRLPGPIKRAVCEVIAVAVYLPLVALARMLKALHVTWWRRMPLAYYHNKRFQVMRNDSLDRFGTSYEKRYTRAQITELLSAHGFEGLQFSDGAPLWHGVAFAQK